MGKFIDPRNWIGRYKNIDDDVFMSWIEVMEDYGFEESKSNPMFASRKGFLVMINYETQASITIEMGMINKYKKPFGVRYNIDNNPKTAPTGEPWSTEYKRFRSLKSFIKFLDTKPEVKHTTFDEMANRGTK